MNQYSLMILESLSYPPAILTHLSFVQSQHLGKVCELIEVTYPGNSIDINSCNGLKSI